MSTFTGKVALVTGGTRGLGLAAAHAFIRRGAHVVISARSHDQDQQAVEELRIGRFGKPREIGDAVAWLCSEEAGFITGECINIDGGAGAT